VKLPAVLGKESEELPYKVPGILKNKKKRNREAVWGGDF
jgi:hypothetical protein